MRESPAVRHERSALAAAVRHGDTTAEQHHRAEYGRLKALDIVRFGLANLTLTAEAKDSIAVAVYGAGRPA